MEFDRDWHGLDSNTIMARRHAYGHSACNELSQVRKRTTVLGLTSKQSDWTSTGPTQTVCLMYALTLSARFRNSNPARSLGMHTDVSAP